MNWELHIGSDGITVLDFRTVILTCEIRFRLILLVINWSNSINAWMFLVFWGFVEKKYFKFWKFTFWKLSKKAILRRSMRSGDLIFFRYS